MKEIVFDNKTLPDGVDWNMSGAFVNNGSKQLYLDEGDIIIYNKDNKIIYITKVYKIK